MSAEQPEMVTQGASSPEPQLQLEPMAEPMPAAGESRSGLSKAVVFGIGLLLLGGIATGLLGFPGFGTSPPVVPAASEQTVQHSGLIQPVAAADMQKAVNQLLMSDADKAKVRADLASGKSRIGWITVADSDAEDGDWVTLSSAGFEQAVELFHKPTTIAVPYTPGAPVRVTGRIDGDGQGITVAVFVGANSFPLAPMRIGTSVEVPTP
jgi:hypothetical protein